MPSGEIKKKRAKAVATAESKKAPRWLRPFLLQVAFSAVIISLPVAALLAWKQGVVASSPLFDIPFQAMKCTHLPMMQRSAFLEQVRRQAGLPEQLNVLEPNLARDLAAAFSRHPWVARVIRIELLAQREILVDLEFRQPVLELRQSLGSASSLLVTGDGVVVPREEYSKSLLVLMLPTFQSQKPGKVASDPRMIGAARLAQLVQHHERTLDLRSLECDGKELVAITKAGSRVLWGSPPGEETDAQPTTEIKLRRLLEYCASHGNLNNPDGRHVHDLRHKGQAEHRPMGVP